MVRRRSLQYNFTSSPKRFQIRLFLLRYDHAHAVGNNDHAPFSGQKAVRHAQRFLKALRGQHMHVADEPGVRVAADEDRGATLFQHAREDLRLPLVGQRGFGRYCGDLLRDLLGRGGLFEPVVEALAAVAVAARRRYDDDAIVVQTGFGCRHALHSLIDVLVERIAAIRVMTISASCFFTPARCATARQPLA